MSRTAWIVLLLAPGGLVLAPIVWLVLRRRARRPRSRPVVILDLTGMTEIERDEERAS